jgi:hypothetical protein
MPVTGRGRAARHGAAAGTVTVAVAVKPTEAAGRDSRPSPSPPPAPGGPEMARAAGVGVAGTIQAEARRVRPGSPGYRLFDLEFMMTFCHRATRFESLISENAAVSAK